jgi:hypothetical protein
MSCFNSSVDILGILIWMRLRPGSVSSRVKIHHPEGGRENAVGAAGGGVDALAATAAIAVV